MNNKNKNEDFGGGCSSATCGIASKTSYIPKTKKNEIYYFGNPPKKPDSLSNFIKGKTT